MSCYDTNVRLLKKWKDNIAPVAFDCKQVHIIVDWVWGKLVLMTKQRNGRMYYVYRRDAVQGKFVVVNVKDYTVVCTCQTEKGARACCDEFAVWLDMAKHGVVK